MDTLFDVGGDRYLTDTQRHNLAVIQCVKAAIGAAQEPARVRKEMEMRGIVDYLAIAGGIGQKHARGEWAGGFCDIWRHHYCPFGYAEFNNGFCHPPPCHCLSCRHEVFDRDAMEVAQASYWRRWNDGDISPVPFWAVSIQGGHAWDILEHQKYEERWRFCPEGQDPPQVVAGQLLKYIGDISCSDSHQVECVWDNGAWRVKFRCAKRGVTTCRFVNDADNELWE